MSAGRDRLSWWWQPRDFIFVTDRDELRELSKGWQNARHVARSAAAAAFVAPVSDEEQGRSWAQYDLGQTMVSIMLAATDLGIGSGHA